LWGEIVGPRSAFLVDVFIALNSLLSCTAYCLLTGQWVTEGLTDLVGNPFETHRSFVLANTFVIVFIAFIPLCLQRDLHALRHVSMIGVACTLVGVVFLGYQTVKYWSTAIPARMCGDRAECTSTEVLQSHLFQPSWKLMTSFNLCVGMLITHYNVPKFYQEYHTQDPKEFMKTTLASSLISTSVACCMAVLGVLRFGTQFKDGNILSQFNGQFDIMSETDHVLTLFVWLFMAANVTANFPLLFQPMRSSVLQLCGSSVDALGTLAYTAVTLGLLGVSVFLGLVVPNLTSVMKLKGSICGISLAFTIPGILLSVSSQIAEHGAENGNKGSKSHVKLALGIAITAIGLGLSAFGAGGTIFGILLSISGDEADVTQS
jgi:amino acid permease